MYSIVIESNLQRILDKLYKKNRKLYEIAMKRLEEIILNPQHYKPLRYDLKNIRRVHLFGPFILVFKIEESTKSVKFLDLDHHDNIYRKRF
ncbi:MAG TPA: type II toxin-antitoxin system RelE/ParE family toxin [archaeon]|nr:type II toxin-antitoxin system RelE/ParE family toxin [archaeon]